ncbi:hypothetical protein OAG69_00130 [bacterium]|nr:hypothetical protein [bacterium]
MTYGKSKALAEKTTGSSKAASRISSKSAPSQRPTADPGMKQMTGPPKNASGKRFKSVLDGERKPTPAELRAFEKATLESKKEFDKRAKKPRFKSVLDGERKPTPAELRAFEKATLESKKEFDERTKKSPVKNAMSK